MLCFYKIFFSRRKTIIWEEQVGGGGASGSPSIATALYEFRKGKITNMS